MTFESSLGLRDRLGVKLGQIRQRLDRWQSRRSSAVHKAGTVISKLVLAKHCRLCQSILEGIHALCWGAAARLCASIRMSNNWRLWKLRSHAVAMRCGVFYSMTCFRSLRGSSGLPCAAANCSGEQWFSSSSAVLCAVIMRALTAGHPRTFDQNWVHSTLPAWTTRPLDGLCKRTTPAPSRAGPVR